MFADTAQLCTELASTSTRYHEVCRQCDTTGQALASHPLILRTNSLERERTQLQHMHTHEEQAKKELLEWREKTTGSIPVLKEELAKKMGEMIGETVQILVDDQVLVGG